MTLREIEDLIIDLLAEDAHRDPADLRADLAAQGAQLPVDSQFAAEVLAKVEARCGVRLPATAENAKALRSVTTFAQAIYDLVRQQGDSGAATA